MTETLPSESPIVSHNRKLCAEVMRATKTFSRYPRVSEQVECLPLETGKLRKFGYNPALNSKLWLAYRYHVTKLGTRLACAQLGENGQVLSDRVLSIESKSVDDPKVFTHNGDDFISWVEARWDDADYHRTIRCVVKFSKFNDAQLGEVIQPNLPGNDGSCLQKNYVAFSAQNLMVIYQCHPTHRIYDLATGEVHETPGPRWPFGEIRGGTPPIPYEGKLLRFFHSQLRNEFVGAKTRYYLGAYLMESEAPFKVVRVSKRPLLFGSEISDIPTKERPIHYKPNVVFCSGAVETPGGWILSVGENDSACLLVKITPSQLQF